MQTSLLGGPLCTLYYYSPCYFRLDHGPISLCSGVYAELPFWDYEIVQQHSMKLLHRSKRKPSCVIPLQTSRVAVRTRRNRFHRPCFRTCSVDTRVR